MRGLAGSAFIGVGALLLAVLGAGSAAATPAPPNQSGPGGSTASGPFVPWAPGTISTLAPGGNLQAALNALLPGDTLLLAPGTYTVHQVRPVVHAGTPTKPITVRASNPASPPLIRGNLKLWGASYWVLDHLRIQTIDPGADALDIFGGRGWSVVNSEIFGASATGAYANVSIATDTTGTGAPRDFLFAYNCVHDAGNSSQPTDHNIYVSFAGNSTSGGLITRNVVYAAPHGAGIKLGNGGAVGSAGPWGVTVSWNTIGDSGRQLLLHGSLRNNAVYGNLLWHSTQPFNANPKTTLVYVDNVSGSGNVLSHNYGYAASMFLYGKVIADGGDDALRGTPSFDRTGSCSGYQPATPAAQAYGRYGTGAF